MRLCSAEIEFDIRCGGKPLRAGVEERARACLQKSACAKQSLASVCHWALFPEALPRFLAWHVCPLPAPATRGGGRRGGRAGRPRAFGIPRTRSCPRTSMAEPWRGVGAAAAEAGARHRVPRWLPWHAKRVMANRSQRVGGAASSTSRGQT